MKMLVFAAVSAVCLQVCMGARFDSFVNALNKATDDVNRFNAAVTGTVNAVQGVQSAAAPTGTVSTSQSTTNGVLRGVNQINQGVRDVQSGVNTLRSLSF